MTAGLVEVEREDPETDAAGHCPAAYYSELDERMATGFDFGHARCTARRAGSMREASVADLQRRLSAADAWLARS